MINYKALAVLDIMQCLIGFSKRGCCHDTYDVEVVVVQISVSWCSRSARSPLPRVLSLITFSFSIRFRSNVVLEEIASKTHSRQENKQYSKKATRPRRNTKRKWLGPLGWCPIHGPKKHEWWYAEHKLKSWPSQYGFTINGLSQRLSRANTTAHDLSIWCHWIDGDWKSGPKKKNDGVWLL